MTEPRNGREPGHVIWPVNGSGGGQLHLDVLAEASQLWAVRRRVQLWAAACGAAEELTQDLVCAVNEAVTNVVEHAYRAGTGRVCIEASWLAGGAAVDVVDNGRWQPAPPDGGLRCRGLTLVRRLADTVEVRHHDTGTRVHLWWRLPR